MTGDLRTLRDWLAYNPETGVFVWKKSLNRRVGSVAGSPDREGYLRIKFGRKRYSAHRLAWFFTFGRWPRGEVDHINRNPSDNRICNLREATRSQNRANTRSPANVTGFRGVSPARGGKKWHAKITVNYRTRYLGYFNTPEEAHQAYKLAAAEIFGEFATAA